jgi:hypothetical protein
MFTKMVIVAETLLASDAKVIERYITDDVRYAGLCKNEIRGGGGPDGQPPGYVYIALLSRFGSLLFWFGRRPNPDR